MFEFIDNMDLDWTHVAVALILYMIVVGPAIKGVFGWGSIDLWVRVIIAVIMLPGSYLLVNMMANR